MPVEVDNRTSERVDEEALARVVEAVIDDCGLGDAEAAVMLVDGDEMRALNRTHRAIDAETDVLAFPIDEADELPTGLPRLLGDVVVCLPVGRPPGRRARHRRRAAELATLAVHGTLHLAGVRPRDATTARCCGARTSSSARLGAVAWPAS